MINKISLENFKAFKDLRNLKLKPITIITGTNSCGKSSLLQSILLMKQTIESKNISENFLLNGRFVHLGNFENIIHNKDINESVKIGISYNISKEEFNESYEGSFPLFFIFKHLLSKSAFDTSKAKYQINYYAHIKSLDKKTKTFIKSTTITKFNVEIKMITENGNEVTDSLFEAKLLDDDIYQCKWKIPDSDPLSINDGKNIFKQGNEKFKIKFLNLVPTNFELDNPKSLDKDNDVKIFFYVLNDLIKQIFHTITYIGPLREEPSRRYIYEDEIVEIGVKGENSAYIYLSELNKRLNNVYFFNEEENKFYLKETVNLEEAVIAWNKLFNIINFKAEPNMEVIRLQLDSSSHNNTRVNIADVGFGISQIFPIILEGLRMKSNSTLLLEQPEIHLHPKVQMQLADYFISLALSKKNLIVETHSEHIINRLVRRIIEDENNELSKLIAIYFIEPTVEGSIIKPIEIDDVTGIIDWPENFFDQNATEQEKIILASIKKRRKINDR